MQGHFVARPLFIKENATFTFSHSMVDPSMHCSRISISGVESLVTSKTGQCEHVRTSLQTLYHTSSSVRSREFPLAKCHCRACRHQLKSKAFPVVVVQDG